MAGRATCPYCESVDTIKKGTKRRVLHAIREELY